MGELIIGILIVFAIVTIAVVVFVAWSVVTIIKAIVRAVQRSRSPQPRYAPALPGADLVPMNKLRCPRQNCRSGNPVDARFCRRCGISLMAEVEKTPVVARRREMVRT